MFPAGFFVVKHLDNARAEHLAEVKISKQKACFILQMELTENTRIFYNTDINQ